MQGIDSWGIFIFEMMELTRLTQFYGLLLAGLVLCACKKDKTPFADLYVTFEYTGPKIDTTVSSGDRMIFTNFDGSPIVEVPASANACTSPTLIGTFGIGDTIKWHLRLMQPDGGPFLFQVVMDSEGHPVPVQSTLYFYNPADYYFNVSVQQCDDRAIVLIKE